MHTTYRILTMALLGVALSSLATPAEAYLDPSTGSMVISAIIGVFASIALALKTYWYRLRNLFRPRKTDPDREEPEA